MPYHCEDTGIAVTTVPSAPAVTTGSKTSSLIGTRIWLARIHSWSAALSSSHIASHVLLVMMSGTRPNMQR